MSATYEVDPEGRIILSATDHGTSSAGDFTFRYLTKSPVIEAVGMYGYNGYLFRQTGTCEAPRVNLQPTDPLPLTWRNGPWRLDRYTVSMPNPADGFMRLVLSE